MAIKIHINNSKNNEIGGCLVNEQFDTFGRKNTNEAAKQIFVHILT